MTKGEELVKKGYEPQGGACLNAVGFGYMQTFYKPQPEQTIEYIPHSIEMTLPGMSYEEQVEILSRSGSAPVIAVTTLSGLKRIDSSILEQGSPIMPGHDERL